MLDVTPVRAFSDNYIWVIRGSDSPARVAVVDPGEAPPVFQWLEASRAELAAILVTHHHRDHCGGVTELKRKFEVPVIGPAGEDIPLRTRAARGGERVAIEALGLEFDVFDIPGHTRGHIAFYGHGALFCGDTLFSAGCGRLFEGTAAQMARSLGTLRNLQPETHVYCGHEYTANNLRFALAVEPENERAQRYLEESRTVLAQGRPTLPSTLALEIEVNPFLRCETATVRRAASQHAGQTLEDPIEVFATIRRWKDQFR
ncbi:MAG: hydroxyacylglutathione hydrolase [Steroidobacterales bacterium]